MTNKMDLSKYKPIQDKLFISDFDKEIKKLLDNGEL